MPCILLHYRIEFCKCRLYCTGHWLFAWQHTIMLLYTMGGSVYIALSLIRITGICLHVPQGGFTCLHHKESLKSVDIVTYLIHNGAPVDMPSKVCT